MLVMRRSGACGSVQFNPDGGGFLTGGADGPVYWLLAVAEGKPLVGEPRRLLPENSGANERAALSPDGTRFAAIGKGGAFLGALTGDSPLIHIPDSELHDMIEFSPDGRWLRLGGHHRVVVEIRSAADGGTVTNLPTGSSAALFKPGRNELLATFAFQASRSSRAGNIAGSGCICKNEVAAERAVAQAAPWPRATTGFSRANGSQRNPPCGVTGPSRHPAVPAEAG
jgi:hypothetical protein